MYIEAYENITFDNFCNIFKIYFKWTYSKLAQSLNCSERTLQRWRKDNKYDSLYSTNYAILFILLEKECKIIHIDPIKLIIEYFQLPSIYENADYEKVKRLVIYNLNIKLKKNEYIFKSEPSYTFNLPPTEFIFNCINRKKRIKSICMAFHSGWDWLKRVEKSKLIDQLNNMGIKLYILVNPNDVIDNITESMEKKEIRKYYIGYNQGIRQWSICENSLQNLELRISTYPIMRKCYIVRYYDDSFEIIEKEYIYDHSVSDKLNIYHHFTEFDDYGIFFNNEFNFLWNRAYTYKKWHSITPLEEKQLAPNNFLLLYKSQNTTNQDLNNQFIISELSIKEDNKVILKFNISNKLILPLVKNSTELIYTGKVKVADKNIYITLYDQNNCEQITISLVCSLHNHNRYIGIIDFLTPSARPSSYKCICIQEDIIKSIKLETCLELLQLNNETNNYSIMITDKDIFTFYSNNIFK